MVEGARLESVCRGNSTEGSNPSLSAILARARLAERAVFRRSAARAASGTNPSLSANFSSLAFCAARNVSAAAKWPVLTKLMNLP